MASETAQRHVTEIMERDAREMQTLIQTVRKMQGTQDVVRNIDELSEEWDLFDADVFTVRILMIH